MKLKMLFKKKKKFSFVYDGYRLIVEYHQRCENLFVYLFILDFQVVFKIPRILFIAIFLLTVTSNELTLISCILE